MTRKGRRKKKGEGDYQRITEPTAPEKPSSVDPSYLATGAETGSSSSSALPSVSTSIGTISTPLTSSEVQTSSLTELNGFTISWTFSQTPDGRVVGITKLVISPQPKDIKDYDTLLKGLTTRLVQLDISAQKISKELQDEKDKNFTLQQLYLAIVSERDMLKIQLEDMQIKMKTMEDQLKNVQKDFNMTKLAAEVGSWVGSARRLLIKEYQKKGVVPNEIVDEANQSRLWRIVTDYVRKGNSKEFYQLVQNLFHLDQDEWKIVAIEFIQRIRNPLSHPFSPLEYAINLLDYLPSEYKGNKEAFSRLIMNTSRLEASESQDIII